MARYDSVQRLYKPENANDASSLKGDSIRTRALQQTLVMNAVLDSLMTRRQNDDVDALALIADDKQKKKAAELLDKQDADFAKLMPAGARTRGPAPAELGGRGASAPARCSRRDQRAALTALARRPQGRTRFHAARRSKPSPPPPRASSAAA